MFPIHPADLMEAPAFFPYSYIYPGSRSHVAAHALMHGRMQGYAAALRDVRGAERLSQFEEMQDRSHGKRGGDGSAKCDKRSSHANGRGVKSGQEDHDGENAFGKYLEYKGKHAEYSRMLGEKPHHSDDDDEDTKTLRTSATRESVSTVVTDRDRKNYAEHKAKGKAAERSKRSENKDKEDRKKKKAREYEGDLAAASDGGSRSGHSNRRSRSNASQALSRSGSDSRYSHHHRRQHHHERDLPRQVLAVDPEWLHQQRAQAAEIARTQRMQQAQAQAEAQQWHHQRQATPEGLAAQYRWSEQHAQQGQPAFVARHFDDGRGEAVFRGFGRGGEEAMMGEGRGVEAVRMNDGSHQRMSHQRGERYFHGERGFVQ